jgi:hypothetical protein
LDGKSIGNGKCGMIVTLCRQDDGRPVAMRAATGKKEDSEVSEARKLLQSEEVILANKIVTIDPLHNKQETLRSIVQKIGDYLVGTKDKTSDRVNAARNLALTRNALLAIIPFDETKNLSRWLDTYQSYPARALNLLQQARPI